MLLTATCICWTVGPTLAAYLELLAHFQNIARLSHFFRYYFGRCSSDFAELVPLPYSHGWSAHYLNRLYDLSVTIFRCYKYAYVNSFFPCASFNALMEELNGLSLELIYLLGGSF